MTRRHDLDWVRVLAFGLLVLYHVGMYYVSWDWHVKSPAASTTLEPLLLFTAPWRLSLLFLVSGVATACLLDKVPSGFLRARSWRLLLPLLFGMLVIVPPQAYYEVVENLPGGYGDSYLAFWGRYLRADDSFCRNGDCLVLPTWNHLWFVAYLWVYTVALWVSAHYAPRVVDALRRGLGAALAGAGMLVWPVLFFALARMALAGVFESTHALVDDWYNHVQYLGVFVLGFLIATNGPAWDAMLRLRWPALLASLSSYAFIAWYFGVYTDANPPPDALRLLQRAVWGLNQWCGIVAILGFARRIAPGDSPALRYLTTAIFPVYILHQTVIVVAAHHFKPLGLPPSVEGPLLVALTFAVCFAGHEVIRRGSWLRPLFGLKRLPRVPALVPAARQPAG